MPTDGLTGLQVSIHRPLAAETVIDQGTSRAWSWADRDLTPKTSAALLLFPDLSNASRHSHPVRRGLTDLGIL